MTKEEKDNITRLSAICALNVIYMRGCKNTLEKYNTIAIKQEYKYDSTNVSNKKVIDKKIDKAIKNLNLTIDTTCKVLDKIDKSMRETLSDDVVDALIDKLDAVLDSIDLEGVINLK